MKRWSIRFLIFVLVCCMLAGCSAKKEVVISASAEQAAKDAEKMDNDGSADNAANDADASETAEKPASEQELSPTDPREIGDLIVLESTLNDCKEEGLYWVPSETNIVYSVNNVTNGTLQMQSSPANLLCFSCDFKRMASAGLVNIEMRVFEDGELLLSGAYDVDLIEGENTITALLKLPHEVSGSYHVEMWYDGQPAAVAEM